KSAPPQPKSFLFLIISLVIFLILSLFAFYSWTQTQARLRQSQSDYQSLLDLKNNLDTSLASASAELNLVKSEDQFVKNNQLQSEVKDIKSGFSQALKLYEDIVDLRDSRVRVSTIEPLFSSVLSDLSQFKYSQSLSKIATLSAKVTQERQKSLAVVGSVNPDNVTENNTPPGSGFSRQKVKVGDSFFVVDIVAADLNSTRVIVDTASEGDCADNCPVLPLGTYVSRNGAFAGINGSYFCPASYPSCASKKNSFDTLLMNKNKKYFNSDNNVYSTVPAVIFSGASARFVTQSQQWGRDTGVDSVLANYPLLVFNKSLAAGDSSDTKLSAAGNRAFIAAKGSTVYIGVVRGVSVVGAAKVLLEMGMDNALNLDSGGSTALWSGGYKYGPGRDIPNAILFVRK
ncbi:MAG TPA: phosphodiester glycosidase family protein, partial [Candidatus Woesebacteria bacterium]|nr:phosphodiester glycosidase family protein [Candidatus Woesebacteria bacterium]